jgi:hypothetical protein
MRRPSLKNLKFSNEGISKARGGGLREAIIGAAQRLFLERWNAASAPSVWTT